MLKWQQLLLFKKMMSLWSSNTKTPIFTGREYHQGLNKTLCLIDKKWLKIKIMKIIIIITRLKNFTQKWMKIKTTFLIKSKKISKDRFCQGVFLQNTGLISMLISNKKKIMMVIMSKFHLEGRTFYQRRSLKLRNNHHQWEQPFRKEGQKAQKGNQRNKTYYKIEGLLLTKRCNKVKIKKRNLFIKSSHLQINLARWLLRISLNRGKNLSLTDNPLCKPNRREESLCHLYKFKLSKTPKMSSEALSKIRLSSWISSKIKLKLTLRIFRNRKKLNRQARCGNLSTSGSSHKFRKTLMVTFKSIWSKRAKMNQALISMSNKLKRLGTRLTLGRLATSTQNTRQFSSQD